MLVLASSEITAFHVVGGILALWAVLVGVLGIVRHNFPPAGAEKLIMAFTALLVVGTIGAAVTTSEEKPKSGEPRDFKNKAGEEGSEAPDEGGTQAPQTGEQGQEPANQRARNVPGGQTAQTLLLKAEPSGRSLFDKKNLAAKAGTIRVVMENPSEVPHNVNIEGSGGFRAEGKTVPKGGASQAGGNLKPGEYTYYCDVPGHRESGMEGTLVVE